MIIFLIGFMGSGKTYHAKKLADLLNMPWYDLDEVIEVEEGKTIVAIFEKFSESGFRDIENRVLRKLIEDINVLPGKSAIIACGGGTPCFHGNMQYMNLRGVTVWLNPSPDTIFVRLNNEKEKRPLIRAKDNLELKKFIVSKLEERKSCYGESQIEIQDPDINTEELINLISHAKNIS